MKKIIIEQNGHVPIILSVPEGASVRIDDDVTLIESKKYAPKVRDCVFVENPYSDASFYFVCGGFDRDGDPLEMNRIRVDAVRDIVEFDNPMVGYTKTYDFTQITTVELQAEFNKRGYEYDFKTHTARKLVWKPKKGDYYKFVNTDGNTKLSLWGDDNLDKGRFAFKNCFHPDDTEGIEKYINYIKNFEK